MNRVLEELGQLFFIGIDGLDLKESEVEFIQKNKVGGILYFSKNYESPAQIAELSNSIQELRDELPLFIAVDHEGGRVQRFKEGLSLIPPMQKVAELGSAKICYEIHKIIADELRSVGVNVDFTPCCDLNIFPENVVIGDRAFGSDGEQVAHFVSAATRGLQANGVLGCGKHFPGHGRTALDSHEILPVVDMTLNELEQHDLVPFRKVIKARVAMIMMSHIIFKNFDEKYPCSLSKKAHDYLREELKFKNLIVADDFEMDAIKHNFGLEESLKLAFQAGSNMVIFRSFAEGAKAINKLKNMVQEDKELAEVITERILWIKDFKKKHLEAYKPIYIPDLAVALKKDQYSIDLLKSFAKTA